MCLVKTSYGAGIHRHRERPRVAFHNFCMCLVKTSYGAGIHRHRDRPRVAFHNFFLSVLGKDKLWCRDTPTFGNCGQHFITSFCMRLLKTSYGTGAYRHLEPAATAMLYFLCENKSRATEDTSALGYKSTYMRIKEQAPKIYVQYFLVGCDTVCSLDSL